MGLQLSQIKAQTNLMNAESSKAYAEANKIKGVDTDAATDYVEYKKKYTIEELKKWFSIASAGNLMTLAYNGKGVLSSEDYLYGKPLDWKIENMTNILTENLTDLDQLREDILGMGNNRFELTRESKLGGNKDFEYINTF